MTNGCTLSKGFILTFDCDAIQQKDDLYRKGSDCKLCSLEQKIECEQKLYDLLKEFPEQPKSIDTEESILHLNNHFNGKNRETKSNKRGK